MTPVEVFSPAKLNWLLRVGALRGDGFHALGTIFQTLDFGDTILVERRRDNRCELSGFPPDINPSSNLVLRAWESMKRHFPGQVGGVDVAIDKILPRGGGLGGGSSNAAAMLLAVAQLFNIEASPDKLEQIGAELGSDVAFFVRGGTAVATGRGEMLQTLPKSVSYWLVLITPPTGISTAEAYGKLDAATRTVPGEADMAGELQRFVEIMETEDPVQLAAVIHNDFEIVTQNLHWFQEPCQKLLQAGALRAFLCGSGSTVAGLCSDAASAQKVAAATGGMAVKTLMS